MKGPDLPVLRDRVAFRIVLAFFALAQALNGLWALFAPRSFYGDFPFGRGWVELLPPYNEHLTRDLGALYLATAVLLGAAAWSLRRPFVGSALIAWLAFAAPHAIWRLFNLDPISTGDAAANLVTLASTVFLPTALLILLARDRPPNRLAAENGQSPGGRR
jgi:hypothetical protein